MKHLVKKYVRALDIGQEVVDVLNNAPVDESKIAELSQNKLEGYYGMLQFDNERLIQTFKYVKDNKTFLIPEPDPIVIYFDTARLYHKTINERKTNLFKQLQVINNIVAVNGDFYWYYSTVCNYVIFLFLAIEALINKIIPMDYEYKKPVQDKKVELYNKFQIQRHIEFIEKIKNVLPDALGKSFVVEQTHKFEDIKKLKLFRDEIVHTKSHEAEMVQNYYEDLYTLSLDFDFDKTLKSAQDFINFYQPNLIEECSCGNDD